MSYDLIEGVDYIFDRYAFLGLEPNADSDAIHRAIVQKRAGNSPDRLATLDEGLQKKGAFTLTLVAQCEDVLEDPTKRSLYDERLAWFKQHRPDCISNNGNQIINTNFVHIDMRALLAEGNTIDWGHAEKTAQSNMGYDPSIETALKALYESDKSNAENRAAYQAVLEKKYAYLETLENIAWSIAGIFNRTSSDTMQQTFEPSDYCKGVDTEIERYKTEHIPSVVALHTSALLAGTAEPLQFLPPGNPDEIEPRALTSPDDTATREKIIARAAETLESKTTLIKELAKRKAETIHALLDTCEIQELNDSTEKTNETDVIVVLKKPESEVIFLVARISKTAPDNYTIEASPLNDDFNGKNLDGIREREFERSTISIEFLPILGTDSNTMALHAFHAYKRFHGHATEIESPGK